MDIKDVAGVSEPIKKLIEVCAEGIGAVARPWLIRRDVKALVDAQATLEKANLLVASAELATTGSQIAARIEYREAKRHRNLCAVVSEAKESMPNEVSEQPVDSDWIARFFSYAEDVSNEEMQRLWGRLLSGEVSRPGSFSMRALELTKSLSSEEASIFHVLCNYSLDGAYVFSTDTPLVDFKRKSTDFAIGSKEDEWEDFYAGAGITRPQFTLLEEIGLLSSAWGATRTWKSGPDPAAAVLVWRRGDQCIGIRNEAPTEDGWSFTVPTIDFTHIARQLNSVFDLSPFHDSHLRQLIKSFERHGLKCQLGTLMHNPDAGKKQWRMTDIDTNAR